MLISWLIIFIQKFDFQNIKKWLNVHVNDSTYTSSSSDNAYKIKYRYKQL